MFKESSPKNTVLKYANKKILASILSEKFDFKVQILLKIQILKIHISEMREVIELGLLLKLVTKQDL
jgi:hypothetical protein